MHGGKSTGPRIKHGQRTQASIQQRQDDRTLLKNLNVMIAEAQVITRTD
jgi:hypothetical protein